MHRGTSNKYTHQVNPYSYAKQMQKKAGLLFLASNERTVKSHETQKRNTAFFSAQKKSGKFMGPPTIFYISMHSYQNTDKINPEYPDNPKN